MNKVKTMKKTVSVLLLGLSMLLTNNSLASPGNFLKKGIKKVNQRVQKTLNGNSALHLAVKSGDLRSVKLVYKNNPELLEKVNDKGETPLFTALDEGDGDLSIVIYLIKNCGANVNAINNEDESILFLAIIYKRIDIIRWLLAAGADVNINSPVSGDSLLYMSTCRNHEITTMLLVSGANVNELNPEGEKPNLFRYSQKLVDARLTPEQAIAEEKEKLIEFARQINNIRRDNGKDELPYLPQISAETMYKLHNEFEKALQKENKSCSVCGSKLFTPEGYNSIADGQQSGECVYGVRQ